MASCKLPRLLFLALLFGLLAAWPTLAQTEPGATVVTHHETIPNPVFGSNFRVADGCKNTLTPCPWEEATTWATGAPPDADTHVIIDGNVQINEQTATALSVGIYPGGQLAFAPNRNTRLQTGEIVVFAGGTLQLGTPSAPINAANQAEVVIRDLPFTNDPKQHLRGILVIDGTVQMHGRPLGATFLRATAELLQNDSSVRVASSALAVGWQVGDQVVIPTSAQCPIADNQGCPDQTEDHTISAISADGRTLTLAAPLQFDHPGARDHTGKLDFLPHVLNKSRNVIIRSENPNGVRGHLLLHGRAAVDIRYVALQDLGRTDIQNLGPDNQKGRYPLHAHHLIGPVTSPASGYQFTLIGNVVDFGAENRQQNRKWGIAIHGSHYGLIERNLVDWSAGAGIVTEDGSETGNRFQQNFVVRVVGGNGARDEDRDPGDNTKLGRAGVGFWFNGGGGNFFAENVAAALAECISCYGFKFDNVANGDVTIPIQPGADPHAGDGKTTDSYTIGLTDFVDNEVYAAPNGLTIWWVCTEYETPRDNCTSTVQNFRVWHNHRWGYFAYETNQMTLAGFTQRNDPALLTNEFEEVIGLYLIDYFQRKTIIRQADIQGAATAIVAPVHRDVRGTTGRDVGLTLIEDSYLVAGLGIALYAPSTTNGSDDLPPQTTLIRNVRFDHPATRQVGHLSISGAGAPGSTSSNPQLRNDVWIDNYNRAAGADGEDLYLVPSYQAESRCDDAIGECANNVSAAYPAISGGRIYPLRAGVAPTPVATATPSATATVAATPATPTPTTTPTTTPTVQRCPPLPAPTGRIVNVATVAELQAAVNDLTAGTTILVADGTYDLTNTLNLRGVNNVTLRSASGQRDQVILRGRGMDNADYGAVPHVLAIYDANQVTIADLTLRDAYFHNIQIHGEAGPQAVRLYNLHLVDAGEQIVKGSTSGPPGPYADGGQVECSLIEYSDRARSAYTNGVDVLAGANWVIRDNVFRNIRAPVGELAGPALLFWRNSRNTLVERNLFIECDRAIALGLAPPDENARDGEKTYDHQGGIIRNNMIYRSGPGDVGITVNYARDFAIDHNTVIQNNTFPDGAIEYRYAASSGAIRYNLTDGPLWQRDGASANLVGNRLDAQPGWFVNPTAGDLHLLAAADAAIDQASALTTITDDFDGQPRPQGNAPDIGADELGAVVATPTPIAPLPGRGVYLPVVRR